MGNEPNDLVVPLSGLDLPSAKQQQQDARGWSVTAANGLETGHVSDVLIDTRTAEVHAFVVELSGNSDLGSGAYHVLVAAEQASVDPARRTVHLNSLTWTDVALLPPYGDEPRPAQSDDTVVVQPSAPVPEAVSREVRMTLFEEELQIGKKTVDAGEVVIGKRVEVEPVRETVQVMREDVVVERRPLPPGVGFEPRIEGDVTYIPLVQEELVIEKRLVAREELVVRKRRLSEDQVIEETVRKEVADIRREGEAMGQE